MKKISVNNLVKFRKKLEKNQKTFLNSLIKKNEIKSTEGGNYWVRSLSALSNACKLKDNFPIKEKIAAILEDYKPNLIKLTKDKYDRNLHILHNYEDFNFTEWVPKDANILSKANKKSIIYINTIPVQILPNQIYSFTRENIDYIGGIWFVANIAGFKDEELGMFAESLYIFMYTHFDGKYVISANHCLIVDVLTTKEVTYQMIIDKKIPSILDSTLESIKKIM